MFVMGFWYRLGGIYAWCELIGEVIYHEILQGWKTLTTRFSGRCGLPCRLWMLAPFKGHKDGLTREEYHWNCVQSSTRMCIVWAFGMLKGRWRILLKKYGCELKECAWFCEHVLASIQHLYYIRGQFLEKMSGCKKLQTKYMTRWISELLQVHPDKRCSQ